MLHVSTVKKIELVVQKLGHLLKLKIFMYPAAETAFPFAVLTTGASLSPLGYVNEAETAAVW